MKMINLFIQEEIHHYTINNQRCLLYFLESFDEDHVLDAVVFYSEDSGEPYWVIEFVGFPGFWINAFYSKKESLDFCKQYGFNVK